MQKSNELRIYRPCISKLGSALASSLAVFIIEKILV